LELDDFETHEVDQFFRPCAVDPGRTHAFTAAYPDGQSRRLGTNEYYNMAGTISRNHKLEKMKQDSGIQQLESAIPSPKTANIRNYLAYVDYILLHLGHFFSFYNFSTARFKWQSYVGKQKAIDKAVNILINGGKKYNCNRRKNTRANRRAKRKKKERRTSQEGNVSSSASRVASFNETVSLADASSSTAIDLQADVLNVSGFHAEGFSCAKATFEDMDGHVVKCAKLIAKNIKAENILADSMEVDHLLSSAVSALSLSSNAFKCLQNSKCSSRPIRNQ
jgi:hypothetical protein